MTRRNRVPWHAGAPYLALVEALAELPPRIVPCRREPSLWTSEDAQERAKAEPRCAPCPVLGDCRAVADARPRPTFGVWAGRDRTSKTWEGSLE